MFAHKHALSSPQKSGIAFTVIGMLWWAADHYGRFLTAFAVVKDVPHLLHSIAPFATPIIAVIGLGLFFLGDRLKSRFFPSTAKVERTDVAPQGSLGKLKIYSAVYGTGPDTDIDVTDKLQSMVGDGLVVTVANDLVPRDPDFGVIKRLDLEYSYGNPHRFHITRKENSRLVLPEDTWMRDELAKWNKEHANCGGKILELEGRIQQTIVKSLRAEGHLNEAKLKLAAKEEELGIAIDKKAPQIFFTIVYPEAAMRFPGLGVKYRVVVLENTSDNDAFNVQIEPLCLDKDGRIRAEFTLIPRIEHGGKAEAEAQVIGLNSADQAHNFETIYYFGDVQAHWKTNEKNWEIVQYEMAVVYSDHQGRYRYRAKAEVSATAHGERVDIKWLGVERVGALTEGTNA